MTLEQKLDAVLYGPSTIYEAFNPYIRKVVNKVLQSIIQRTTRQQREEGKIDSGMIRNIIFRVSPGLRTSAYASMIGKIIEVIQQALPEIDLLNIPGSDNNDEESIALTSRLADVPSIEK